MKIKNYLLLFGGLIILGLSSFCSAGTYTYTGHYEGDLNNNFYLFGTPVPLKYYSCDISVSCTFTNVSKTFGIRTAVRWINVNQAQNGQFAYGGAVLVPDYESSYTLTFTPNFSSCFTISNFNLQVNGMYAEDASVDYSCVFTGSGIIDSNVSCPICPSQYTSEECQTEYGLVSSGILNQCNNNLLNCQNSLSGYDTLLNNCSTNLNSCNSSLSSCLQLNCPVSSGGVSWSSLFINDIQHIGAPTINISIPSEIQWDYLDENDEFNLTVDGYNTDTDYIEGLINIQNSKPSKEDLNNIITGLIPLFVPGLVIILFIYFVFKLIKKIF